MRRKCSESENYRKSECFNTGSGLHLGRRGGNRQLTYIDYTEEGMYRVIGLDWRCGALERCKRQSFAQVLTNGRRPIHIGCLELEAPITTPSEVIEQESNPKGDYSSSR